MKRDKWGQENRKKRERNENKIKGRERECDKVIDNRRNRERLCVLEENKIWKRGSERERQRGKCQMRKKNK